MDLSWLKELIQNAPQIIAAASRTPLGIVAEFLLVMAVVALVMFPQARTRVKVLIFLVLVGSGLWAIRIGLRAEQSRGASPIGGKSPPARAFTYVGRILDRATVLPIANAEVDITVGKTKEHDFTRNDGTYYVKFADLERGAEAELYVAVDGYMPYTDHLTAQDADSFGQVRLVPKQPPRHTPVAERVTYAGRVLDAGSHAPIFGATVTLGAGEPRYTDSHGSFWFDLPKRPKSTITLRVSADGYTVYEENLDKDRTESVDVFLIKKGGR